MPQKKNEAVLTYKSSEFVVYQAANGDWHYSFDTMNNVNSGTKELQVALNTAYESIDEHHYHKLKQAARAEKIRKIPVSR